MFSHKGLDDLEAKFVVANDDHAQLGLQLINEIRRSRQALVEAAIPLEVLAGQIRSKPYAELSRDFQNKVLSATKTIHAAFETHNCANAVADDYHELAHCDIDLEACSDGQREYFTSIVDGEDHVFKFTLDQNGTFRLDTYLTKRGGFLGRLWAGLRFAFGYQSRHGQWDRVELDLPAIERLHRLTNEALDAQRNTASGNLE